VLVSNRKCTLRDFCVVFRCDGNGVFVFEAEVSLFMSEGRLAELLRQPALQYGYEEDVEQVPEALTYLARARSEREHDPSNPPKFFERPTYLTTPPPTTVFAPMPSPKHCSGSAPPPRNRAGGEANSMRLRAC